MNMPNTMNTKAASLRLSSASAGGAKVAAALTDGPAPARRRAPTDGASPSAEISEGLGCVSSRVRTVATTDRPGRSTCALIVSASKPMRTVTRCTILVKLPVALSGGSSENCAPEAGAIERTVPSSALPFSASTTTSTFWPGLIEPICVSL